VIANNGRLAVGRTFGKHSEAHRLNAVEELLHRRLDVGA
jgi:hypothetical protein